MENVCLFPELKEDVLKKEEKVILLGEFQYSAYSHCLYCGRLIEGRVVFYQGLVYLVKECQLCKEEFVVLLDKESQIKKPKHENLPAHYPYFKALPGSDFIDERNIANIQNILFVRLNLTSRCNLDCSICFDKDVARTSDKVDLPKEVIAQKLKKFRKKNIVLFGGEPTMREDLADIIKLVRRSGNYPVLFTNGLKLAERSYLQQLLQAGLKLVCFSLDGFSAQVYKKMRDIAGDRVLRLKLEALDNLRKENVSTIIQFTLAGGINEGEVLRVIDYVRKNKFVIELWLRPLYLCGRDSISDLNKDSLYSAKEISHLISASLGLTDEHIESWTRFKKLILLKLKYLPPWMKLPVVERGKLYLIRSEDKFLPLLEIEKVEEMIALVENNQWLKLLKADYLKAAWIGSFNDVFRSKLDLRRSLFKICLRGLLPYPNSIIYDGMFLSQIEYAYSSNRGDIVTAYDDVPYIN